VLDPRHDARGRPSRAKPGDNRVRLCTAEDAHRADAIVRSLAVYELPCTARRTREKPVDLYVRGSDLERARRIVKKLART
jgi:hypothetical protein